MASLAFASSPDVPETLLATSIRGNLHIRKLNCRAANCCGFGQYYGGKGKKKNIAVFHPSKCDVQTPGIEAVIGSRTTLSDHMHTCTPTRPA